MRRAVLGASLWLAAMLPLSVAAEGVDAGRPEPSPAAAPAPAEVPAHLKPRTLVSVTPNRGVAVGDPITLKIEALVKKGVQISVPEQPLAPFESLTRKSHVEPAGDEQRYVFELDLIALEPGELSIPGLTLRVVGDDGSLAEVKTAPQSVSVRSLIANEPNAEPKPPTKPVQVIEDDYTLAYVALGIVGIAAIAALTLLVQRWLARRPKSLPPPPPERPAWDVALSKLAELDARKATLLAEDRGGEFVDGVSDALREYLGRRFGFEGLESTTDEILSTLERIRPHKLSLSGVSLLLEQCDLVKFARATPDLEQCDDLWNGAVGLIRATTPLPEPEKPAGAKS
ncbi:MAG: hypothetical protein QM778_01785 [Myxococcales bacterium]